MICYGLLLFLGIGFLLSIYADFLIIFRLLCSIILAIMGIQIVYNYKKVENENDKLLKTGVFSGFIAGFLQLQLILRQLYFISHYYQVFLIF